MTHANVLDYAKVVSEKKPYLSVVVSMPKGTVQAPDVSRRMAFFFRDMTSYLPGIIGLTVFFLYYLIIWVRVGRDPEGKSIVPFYRPPGMWDGVRLVYCNLLNFGGLSCASLTQGQAWMSVSLG